MEQPSEREKWEEATEKQPSETKKSHEATAEKQLSEWKKWDEATEKHSTCMYATRVAVVWET